MLARIRKAQESDSGFTLIELLVVMIIIGILAAIAIPVFLNQRKSAKDSALKSDLRNVATSMESYYTNQQAYGTWTQSGTSGTIIGTAAGSPTDTAKVSSGDTLVVKFDGSSTVASTAFCILGTNGGASHAWVYQSDQGGLQASSVVTCNSTTYPNATPQ